MTISMERPRAVLAMGAGFLGTAAMTVVMGSAQVLGLPKLDMAAVTAMFLSDSKMPGTHSDEWWIGLIAYFIVGAVILPLGYFALYPFLRGPSWLRGLIWGLLLFLLLEVAVLPLIGMGRFSSLTAKPTDMLFSALIGHVAYGILTGLIAVPDQPDYAGTLVKGTGDNSTK